MLNKIEEFLLMEINIMDHNIPIILPASIGMLFALIMSLDDFTLDIFKLKTVKSEVDWSKVEVNTPIYVKDWYETEWQLQYFAKYEYGQVYTWANGMTSFETSEKIPWRYAKLAEQKGAEMDEDV